MNRDSDRSVRPDAGGERHAVSITRMCLRSGSVQLPFALAGRLPQGELLVHDSERDESIVLWSDPPRTLAGLGPLFEAHELQVNDQLVLELQGHDLRLGIRKRPRRSRPQVTPSTWESHRQADAPRDDEDPAAPDDAGEAPGEPGDDPGRYVDGPHEDGPGPSGAGGHRADPYDGDPHDAEAYGRAADDDAPRAPRVRVSPLSNDAVDVPEPRRGAAARASGDEPMDDGGGSGWLGGVWRSARSWFGGGREGRDSDATPHAARERDWTDAWDDAGGAPDDGPLAAPPTAPADGLDSAPGLGHDPGHEEPPDAAYVFEYDDGAFGEPARRTGEEVREEARSVESAEERTAPTPAPAPTDAAPPQADAGADDPERSEGAAARATTWQPETDVPSRAERFLAGDLRTRLLRFLSSPDMPLIAKSEMIASRFDLDDETARDMLADIADDPPPGIRLTPVREGAWRIERTRS